MEPLGLTISLGNNVTLLHQGSNDKLGGASLACSPTPKLQQQPSQMKGGRRALPRLRSTHPTSTIVGQRPRPLHQHSPLHKLTPAAARHASNGRGILPVRNMTEAMNTSKHLLGQRCPPQSPAPRVIKRPQWASDNTLKNSKQLHQTGKPGIVKFLLPQGEANRKHTTLDARSRNTGNSRNH